MTNRIEYIIDSNA